MINNNLAQYSSYILIDQNQITLEAIVHYLAIFIKKNQFGGNENFTCVLKYLLNSENDNVFEMEAFDSRLKWKHLI